MFKLTIRNCVSLRSHKWDKSISFLVTFEMSWSMKHVYISGIMKMVYFVCLMFPVVILTSFYATMMLSNMYITMF